MKRPWTQHVRSARRAWLVALAAALVMSAAALAAVTPPNLPAGAKPPKTPGLSIAYAQPGPAAYFDGWRKEWNRLIKQSGAKQYYVVGDWTPQKQADQVAGLIAKKPNVLVIHAPDPKAALPLYVRAKQAGIKVIADLALPPAAYFKYLEGFVGPLDDREGRVAARTIASLIGTSGGVLEIRGSAGSSPSVDRAKGFAAELAKIAPGIKILDDQFGEWNNLEKAYDLAKGMLQKHGSDVDAIFVQDDIQGVGAARAAKDAGYPNIKVIGIGGSCQAFKSIRSGELTGTIQQDPAEDARRVFASVVKVWKGGKLPRYNWLGTPFVSQTNIAKARCTWG